MKLTFMGDFGDYPQEFKDMVKKKNFSRLFLIGDNFYPTLETTFQLEEAKMTFEDIKPKNIHPLLGNHDWDGDTMSQMDFKSWDFPCPFYYVPVNKKTGVWMLDTQILDPRNSMFPLWRNIDSQTGDHKEMRKTHIEWLWKSLEKYKDVPNKIFCGHYPLVSAGSYPTNKTLTRVLLPMMKQYHVKVYISGHDHSSQHLEYKIKKHTVHQFIAGSCGQHEKYPQCGSKDAKSLFYDDDGAFLRLDDKDGMNFSFHRMNEGEDEIYSIKLN
jgi:predicted phosphodiesterase